MMKLECVTIEINETYDINKEIVFYHHGKEFIKLNFGGFVFNNNNTWLDYFKCKNIFENIKNYVEKYQIN